VRSIRRMAGATGSSRQLACHHDHTRCVQSKNTLRLVRRQVKHVRQGGPSWCETRPKPAPAASSLL
jgi:hypothetical protein